MKLGIKKYIPYYGKIFRINIYVENFTINEDTGFGFPSGTVLQLLFNIYKNNNIIATIPINYESGKTSDYVYDNYCNYSVKPGDIIKIDVEKNFESGYSGNYSNVIANLHCSKTNI